MKIKIEPFLMKRGNKLAKAAVEFDESDSFLAGYHLVGFTICEDEKKELFILFPASILKQEGKPDKAFFFLRPRSKEQLGALENLILDKYEDMIGVTKHS